MEDIIPLWCVNLSLLYILVFIGIAALVIDRIKGKPQEKRKESLHSPEAKKSEPQKEPAQRKKREDRRKRSRLKQGKKNKKAAKEKIEKKPVGERKRELQVHEDKPSEKEPAPLKGFWADLEHAKLYEILLPPETRWDSEKAKSFLEQIMSLFGGRVVLRIVVESGKVAWQLFDCRELIEDSNLVVQAIKSRYPAAEVTVTSYRLVDEASEWVRMILPFKLGGEFFRPIKSVAEIKGDDPLAALVQSMADLREGERYVYTLYVNGIVDKKTRKWARNQINIPLGRKMLHYGFDLIDVAISEGHSSSPPLTGTGRTGKGRYIEKDQKVFEHKLYDQPLFQTYLLLQKDGEPDNEKRIQVPANEITILETLFATDYNFLELNLDLIEQNTKPWWEDPSNPDSERANTSTGIIGRLLDNSDQSWEQLKMILSTEEIASLWHLPHQGFTASEIAWVPSGRVRAPTKLIQNKEGVLLGKNYISGQEAPIRILDEDRSTHINIVGKTGVGKSTLMHNLIHQDIKDGKGVGVVDPHGRLVSDILRQSITEDRIDDVVIIDIANEEYPPPLNPLVMPGELDNVAAGQIVAVLDKIYDIKAKRVEDSMTAALATLSNERTPTVRDVVKLFSNIEYRHRFLEGVEDIVTLEFWEDFEDQSPSMQRDLSYPVTHRMRHFYRNPTLYPILCHPDTLDFSEFIADKRIILLSLGADERKIPAPEQQLLGAVLVSQLQMAAMASLETATPFFLYIDEVQKFVTSSLDEMLAGARKYKLHLTMANQFLGQLRGKILDSVMGNIGATVVFQVGLNDAKLLAPYFKPEFDVEDLVNHALYNSAVKMRFQGETLSAFSMQTMPPLSVVENAEAAEREEMIRQNSRDLYTPKSRDDVLEWLEERYPKPKFGVSKKGNEAKDEDWVVKKD